MQKVRSKKVEIGCNNYRETKLTKFPSLEGPGVGKTSNRKKLH